MRCGHFWKYYLSATITAATAKENTAESDHSSSDSYLEPPQIPNTVDHQGWEHCRAMMQGEKHASAAMTSSGGALPTCSSGGDHWDFFFKFPLAKVPNGLWKFWMPIHSNEIQYNVYNTTFYFALRKKAKSLKSLIPTEQALSRYKVCVRGNKKVISKRWNLRLFFKVTNNKYNTSQAVNIKPMN